MSTLTLSPLRPTCNPKLHTSILKPTSKSISGKLLVIVKEPHRKILAIQRRSRVLENVASEDLVPVDGHIGSGLHMDTEIRCH